ncbi:MAG: hypothetical protein MJ147_04235 [Clostridia bacterium]|nr:hypothetical protein [Clostridia bacterium]
MYNISVPLVRFDENFEKNISEARKLGASRILLCPARATSPKEKIESEIKRIEKSIKIYNDAGFETGVWISTMGHGGPLVGLDSEKEQAYTPITGLHGITTEDSFCPLDKKFSSAVCDYLKKIARAGAKTILLDDDFRFSHRGDCGCTCALHIKEYEKRLSEKITREQIMEKAFTGGYNRYRQIYYDMLGDTLRDFAKEMRSAIDEVDPSIRFSLCSVTSTWDCDGADSIELSKIMAGKTKPFLRLIGAPYWASGSSERSVQYIAELERMEAHWCKNKGIEIFAEGDTYPRPRFNVPAAYLEMFDTILRADGNFDGAFKYGIDYVSSPFYETGYSENAQRNSALYEKIEKHFNNKKTVGINVTCQMKKILHKEFSDPQKELDSVWDNEFYQTEQLMLTGCSLPSTYENADVTIAFGENAKYISNAGNGFIIDAEGAEFLERKGIDTGIKNVGEKISVQNEIFFKENEVVYCGDLSTAVEISAKENAEILSIFESGNEQFPAAIKYENASGQRFLIFACKFNKDRRISNFMKNYMRQEQLIREYNWLAEKKLPAVCKKHPNLYIMAKKDESSMAVGLWNIFPDKIFDPVIELDKNYSSIEFINCTGSLQGDKVILDGNIHAFDFAGFEVFE